MFRVKFSIDWSKHKPKVKCVTEVGIEFSIDRLKL